MLDYSNLKRTQEGPSLREFHEMTMEQRLVYFQSSPDFHKDSFQDEHTFRLTKTDKDGELFYGKDKITLTLYAEAEFGLVRLVEVETCPYLISSTRSESDIMRALGFSYSAGEKTAVAVFMNHEFNECNQFMKQKYPEIDFDSTFERFMEN